MTFKGLVPILSGLLLVVTVVHSARVLCPVRLLKSVGPTLDGPFTDVKIWPYGKITRFHFCLYKGFTSAFRFSYGTETTPWHGAPGLGECKWLEIRPKEWIHGATLYVNDDRVVSIELRTNERKIGPYGNKIGKKFVVNGRGQKLAFVSGRIGDFIRQIAFWFYYV